MSQTVLGMSLVAASGKLRIKMMMLAVMVEVAVKLMMMMTVLAMTATRLFTRSEAEEDDSRGTRGSGRKPSLGQIGPDRGQIGEQQTRKPSLGSTPAQLSLSTTSSLSSTSTTSAARLVQSSLRWVSTVTYWSNQLIELWNTPKWLFC